MALHSAAAASRPEVHPSRAWNHRKVRRHPAVVGRWTPQPSRGSRTRGQRWSYGKQAPATHMTTAELLTLEGPSPQLTPLGSPAFGSHYRPALASKGSRISSPHLNPNKSWSLGAKLLLHLDTEQCVLQGFFALLFKLLVPTSWCLLYTKYKLNNRKK